MDLRPAIVVLLPLLAACNSGPRPPVDYNITELVVLEHAKAADVASKMHEMGIPDDMVIHESPHQNAVLLTGHHKSVRQAVKLIAAIDK